MKGKAPITDIEVALSKKIAVLKKQGKKILITIDEAVNTNQMKTFVVAYNILIQKNLPVFLLVTALYENMYNLQNEKSLTFLYRAPKIELKALNYPMMAKSYEKNLEVTEKIAKRMAKLTKGYSFAFQVPGYFTYEKKGFTEEVCSLFRQYLEQYSYEKIWSELSLRDRFIAYGIAKTKSGSIKEIRRFLELDTNAFNPYRKRLILKGIVDGTTYGYLSFILPLFDEYVIEMYEERIDSETGQAS